MMPLTYVKPERLSLRTHPGLDERWVQARIADDPGILGLGDLILKDKERMQPRAGRLDLLLQHADDNRRFEVEVQLGATDESHIIRTIEYWDIERKRYPQYDHTAVLVAEDVTSRFLNVVSLLNGSVPLVVIQMSALQIGSSVALTFTTVLNVMSRGLVDEDEEVAEPTDRAYWEARGSKLTVGIADDLLVLVQAIDPSFELKYNKFYVGLARDGRPLNFAVFKPKKNWLNLEIRLAPDPVFEDSIVNAGLEPPAYDSRERRYRIRLEKGGVQDHRDVLSDALRASLEFWEG